MRRFHGFRDSLADRLGEDHELRALRLKSDTPQRERDALMAWLEERLDDVTALFCYNDLVAISALEAVQSLGKSVPGDVSIVGFDDLPVGQMSTPNLTTVRVDWRAIGAEAIHSLAQRRKQIDGPARELQFGGTLLARGSSAQIRK